jgi:hypothetical protein
VKLQISNTGESTARSVRLALTVAIRQGSDPAALTQRIELFLNDMPKGQTYERAVPLDITQNQAKPVSDRKGLLFVVGEVNFVDVFNGQIYSNFVLFSHLLKTTDYSNFVPLERPPTTPAIDQAIAVPKQKK